MSVSITVRWAGKEYSMENIGPEDTVWDLKVNIQRQTGVRPERQKLLNLKVKGEVFLSVQGWIILRENVHFVGRPATDDMKLGSLALKDNFKLMMMGSLETEIAPDSYAHESIIQDNDTGHDNKKHGIESPKGVLSCITLNRITQSKETNQGGISGF